MAASSGLVRYIVKELTRDHHPDRDDERSRVEAAGGYVADWGGVSRGRSPVLLVMYHTKGDVLNWKSQSLHCVHLASLHLSSSLAIAS